MQDDSLNRGEPRRIAGRTGHPARYQDQLLSLQHEPYPSASEAGKESEEEGLDLRRYLLALLRYKWLIVAGALLGAIGAAVAWRSVPLTYTAQGNFWIEVENRGGAGDVAPIRASGLLQSNAWTELLLSYAVLDSVVLQEHLYVAAPEQYRVQFASLSLDLQRFVPGEFELGIAPNGTDFTLGTPDGIALEQGHLGEPIGSSLGFRWVTSPNAFPAGSTIPFTVRRPRDVARGLQTSIRTRMDRAGNFLQVSLDGGRPEQIASTLNAVMERHVDLAAELKSAKLDQTLVILEEQLDYAETELARSEQELEEFRVTTISLPSDRSAPIAAGLDITRDPVFGNFFAMRMDYEQVRRDRMRLQAAYDAIKQTGEVRIESLETIPAANGSSELRRTMDDLVQVRAELRVLRSRYSDDYPLVQDVLFQLQNLERRSIPQVVEGILAALEREEAEVQEQIDDASVELEAIPPRTIEEGRLERRVAIAETLYNDLRGRVETARLAAASSIPDVRILDRAAPPQRPTGDERMRWAMMIFFGCLGTALGGAILLDRVDARYRYAADVTRDIGLDILGSIPRIESRPGKQGLLNAAQALEAFRELRIHVGFAHGSAGPVMLAITSPSEGEGKSLVASNLAVAFAEVGRRTLLVDGDTRRGDAHRLLGLSQSPGLIDYLKERSNQEIIQTTSHDNLDFIGSGSRGTSTPELLASPRMAELMGTFKRSYDVIIVDCPPLAAGGDSLILATLANNMAIVIRPGATEKQLTQVKLDQLSRLPIRVLGAILNDVNASDGYHYYYTSYLPAYQPVPEEGDEESVQLISDSS